MNNSKEPENWVIAIILIGMMILYFAGETIYKEYLSREAKLTEVIEESINNMYSIIGLEVFSVERFYNTNSKAYHCRFGVIMGSVGDDLDIEEYGATIMQNRNRKPKYEVVNLYKIDE